ncbi:hypothetical protein J437_LFUL018518 [Ladona fulva]|uniref:Uncharacterized protein n=1 Tax=Ladona fulva TaxID=123851 RepID=A0A8K0KQW1_LADFU|nr:hypothetical protein J437_LFUL018518 [Ladona fulva]
MQRLACQSAVHSEILYSNRVSKKSIYFDKLHSKQTFAVLLMFLIETKRCGFRSSIVMGCVSCNIVC